MAIHDDTTKIERDVLQEQSPRMKHLFRLFGFAFNCTRVISTIYLGVFLALSLLRPVFALLWGRYIQIAERAQGIKEMAAACLLLAGYAVIRFLTELMERYLYLYDETEQLNVIQTNRQQERLYAKLYRKLASVSPEYFEIPKVNDRIEQVFRFTTDKAGGLNTSVMLQGYIVVSRAVSVATITSSLYIFSPWLCLMVFLALLPTVWGRTVGQKLLFEFMKNNTGLLRKADYFQGLMLSTAGKEIKTLGVHDFFYQKWRQAADEYTRKEEGLIRAQSKFLILNSLVINATTVAGMIIAILLMAAGQIDLGALGAVLLLVSTLVNDMKELLTGYVGFHMKKQEAAQFFDLMEMPEQEPAEGSSYNEPDGAELREVSYRYPMTEKYVLNDVNLTIHRGEKIAFVGENGAGKSTAVKLLAGILQPSYGKAIFHNSGKEEQENGKEKRGNVVFQDSAHYLTFSVADNVYLGDTHNPRDEKRIGEALSFAGLGETNGSMILGKEIGGGDLSGGQWQKLSIARSVYRNKGLIILDEPTSSLDPLAETEIIEKYLRLAEGRTVVFVTHRIGMAALADRIIVFSKGKIVQEGTHTQLINQGGEYARLYQEQAKWYRR